MSDCRPDWYKKYSDAIQNWMDGKTAYHVFWKDNEGTEYRYATYAENGRNAIMNCAMAHPLVMCDVIDVHQFAHYDLMTKEQFAAVVDDIIQKKYIFGKDAVEHFMWLVDSGYCRGRTPDEVADGIMYEAEDIQTNINA